ncbi:hypothetical protein B0H67DRAFT_278671 [Lasiosphaeris hirsuta]|uniref:Uncharacterized protein n=1 Tax=Lasiosphaeris hirsuta TaxID=260670 RepID=A0AA40A8C4_9PEZI|nr:hypothetical protein B0H67DRAFT_278671 [Lasiosphaeris hirsuta]
MSCSQRSRRICHLCGDRIMPQTFCPSCGHPLCNECKRLAYAQAPAFIATPETNREPLAVDAPPANMVGIGSTKAEPARTKEPSLKNMQREQESKRVAENQSAKRSSVKNNPFIIADQIAKAKVAEPQSSNTHILAAPPSIPPKYAMVRQDKGLGVVDNLSRKDEQHPRKYTAGFTKSGGLKQRASKATLDAIVSETTASNWSTHNHPPFRIEEHDQQHEGWSLGRHSAREKSESTTTGTLSPRALAAEDITERTSSPIMGRLKVLARQPSSGMLERVLEVEVEEGGRHIPKVRVASPPPWLKHPTHTPGNIEGRLRRIASRGGPYLSHDQSAEETSQFRQKRQNKQPMGGTPNIQPKASRSDQPVSAATMMDQTSTRGTVQMSPPSEVATVGVSEIGIQPKLAVPTIARQRSLWKIQQHRHLMSDAHQPKVATSHTAASELGTEAETEVGENEAESVRTISRLDDDDDVGIQGLTIVLHLRGKDDLVISTNLTQDSQVS